MTICIYNACTVVSDAAIEDLMIQARRIKYDVIGLTETIRSHPLSTVDEMEKNCSEEHVTVEELTIFVAYASTSRCKEDVEAFYTDLEKIHKEDHTLYRVIVGDFNAKIDLRSTTEKLHIGIHGLQWTKQGEKLSEFIMTTKTIHGNSQFQKPSSLRWTWKLPGGGCRNEIDYSKRVLSARYRCCAKVPFTTGSSPPPRIFLQTGKGKAARFRKRTPTTIIN
ncbi:hypothetical protein RB195_024790 [Necator americanus]|uniref:Endonuclease/exonuclease/phosphatase domain-containing protein n=1 Tax=Necator americanus TaxID=51031 RepID=A0ABR1EPL9_NECAM